MSCDIIRLLAIGDVVGKSGSEYIRKNLWNLRKKYMADIVIANGENSAQGNGITKDSAENLFLSGTDIITTGNHVYRRAEVYTFLDDNGKVLRPANYPGSCYGFGHGIYTLCGKRVLVMNIMGNVYMDNLACPFETAEKILEKEKGNYDFSVCDIHAEATSEKIAFAKYFDGKINIVFGTHTHVQTNDAQILPLGTGYITDIGMTGPYNSVLGIKNELVIKMFTKKLPTKFEQSEDKAFLSGALFEFDTRTNKVISVNTVTERE